MNAARVIHDVVVCVLLLFVEQSLRRPPIFMLVVKAFGNLSDWSISLGSTAG